MYLDRTLPPGDREQDPSFDPSERVWLIAFMAAHVPLALALGAYSPLAAVHAGATVLLGLLWALFGQKPVRLVYIAAYLTGAEVLWRMTNNRLPWEAGKYAVVLILVIGLVRAKGLKGLTWPLLSFGLLIPSAALTVMEYSAAEARDQISFNLSGPLAIVVCARFFATVSLTPGQLRQTFIILVSPVIAVATIALYGILTASEIVWTTESNFATSGGFGPNQVSAILGFAVLAAFLCVCDQRSRFSLRAVLMVLVVWLATQSVITFSRTGMYCAFGAMLASSFYLMRSPQTRIKVFLVAGLVAALGYYVIWPRLDEFTEGNLTARFQSIDPTERTALGEEDIEIFMANPVLGVGPGVSKLAHMRGIAAHTEFTRLLSEHGLFGLAAMLLMIWGIVRNIRRAPTDREKAVAAALMCWSVLFMLNSAMRLVAPSFAFGISFATFIPFSPLREQRGEEVPSSRQSIRRPAFAR